MSEPKIISAIITAMPKAIFDPMPQVIVKFDDKSEKTLFKYYPDEISFTPEEFIGLTEAEAHTLKVNKDKRYLQG